MRLIGLVVLLLGQSVWSLHESEVGIVDWHKKLVGVPLTASPATAPVFHRVGTDTTRSIVLTATSSNVLAGLNPANGSVAWRYIYDSKDVITTFHAYQNIVASLSGPGGATLRVFDALDGHLLVEKRLHDPSFGQLTEPNHIGTNIAFLKHAAREPSEVFALTNGNTIQSVSGLTGEPKWTWTSPDHVSVSIFTKIAVTPTTLYAIGLSKTFADYKLHVTALDTSTGDQLASETIPSSLTDFRQLTVVRFAKDSDAVAVAWIDGGSLKSILLDPKLKAKAVTVKGTAFESIVDLALGEHGRFLAVKEDGAARLVKLDVAGGGLKSVHEFSSVDASAGAPVYSGGLDKDGNVYVSRIRWSSTLRQAVVDLYSGHLAQGLSTSFTFPFDTLKHGVFSHATLDCAQPSDLRPLTRIALTTSTGAVQLWQHDQVQWTREEALASVSGAAFVELPEQAQDSAHSVDGEEGFLQRVLRQAHDARGFPGYAMRFGKRFVTGSYDGSGDALSTLPPPSLSQHDLPLARDAFGFRQILVLATPYGIVYGVDTRTGEIVWSRLMGLGWAHETGGSVMPVRVYVVKAVGDAGPEESGKAKGPEVIVVAQRRSENTLIDTVVYHIDATTGKNVGPSAAAEDADDGFLAGTDVIPGPLVESFVLPGEVKAAVLIDQYLQVYIYPDTPETQKAFRQLAPSLNFPLRSRQQGSFRIIGHRMQISVPPSARASGSDSESSPNPESGPRAVAHPTWKLALLPGETLLSIQSASRGTGNIASVGKVLGNRTTLYKYLNPRVFVVLSQVQASAGDGGAETSTSNAKTEAMCAVRLVDAAKGAVLYSVLLPSFGGVCDVHVSLTENWLVYHYFDGTDGGEGTTKGWKMVTVELYEGKGVDDKTKSSEISAFSEEIMDLTALEQAYVFPHGITAMATTSTKFGISSKDIIVATKNHKIQSIPRRMLNPRRPNRKPTAEEQEEMLFPYDPLVPDDARRTLSHNYEVANIEHIITAPALLESTSLVFAYGLDLFLTRVAPSNTFDVLSENFNKVQLVLTVAGLAAAIVVTRPMVRRKRLRERWYQ
ncbi:hypothetical protein HGRIS_007249 [Hohenbuehelia grisea]|uniref:ER membrane protein complex subunit 1 n=1 Tax=Hohenbuehelia grisea TaxID=104357 RepID=A0ABR3JC98_9AGAR